MKIGSLIFEWLTHYKWSLLLMNATFFVFMAWLLPIHFEENDDVIMCMIANGAFSGEPDGHLVFINALFGWILAGLYRLTGIVEWYTLSLCVLQVLSMTGVLYFVVKEPRIQPWIKCTFLVLMYVLWSKLIIDLQFTTTAGLLCFSGCLAMLQKSRSWRIMGVGAIFVASLVRFHAAGLVGLLCLPMLIMEVQKDRKYVFWLLAVALFSIFGSWGDGLFYKQSDWAEYRCYNVVRGKINDNPNADFLSQDDLPEGVNMDDYNLLLWHQADPQVMTIDKLAAIKEKLDEQVFIHHRHPHFSQVWNYKVLFVLLCTGLLCCLVSLFPTREKKEGVNNACRERRACFYSMLLTCFFFVVSIVYICLFSMLKFRVFLCMIIPMSYQIVYHSRVLGVTRNTADGRSRICAVLIAAVLVLMGCYQARKVYYYSKSVRDYQVWINGLQQQLLKDRDEIINPARMALEQIPPFRVKDVRNHLVAYSWLTKSPLNKGIFEGHDDYVKRGVLYFGEAGQLPPIQLVRGLEKNYGIKAVVETVASNDKYALYSFKAL